MLDSDREKLRAIKTFPSLVKYLRDELDWPIEADDFDDLTFDYEPEELGIDAKTAAKIEQIKQLRPLVTNQPWGIFFLKFEPKHLPVVALRRILSQLVIKKRTSAKRSEQASWNLHDLLFISNYGEGDNRQITFAHFAQDEQSGNLATLKVLGWDYADTALHIDNVHSELKEKLHWPEDESDFDTWRNNWSSAFTLRHREVITTSKELAIRLAGLAKRIRRRASHVLAIETERGPLRKLHKAFQESLIHDLGVDDFADMYAQTITYGLLAARVSRPMGIEARNITDMVPITNPFLKEMLGSFLTVGGRKGKIDFDELGIQEVVELLNSPDTHMEDILRDFGNRTRQEDPVIHFYELFLTEYDKKMKVQRGVFYTPLPVVSYIVQSVHELLQKEFGLEDGLASTATWVEMSKKNPEIKIPEGVSPEEPFVQILDPATGTGTFLVEVIDVIHKTLMDKWKKQGLSEKQCLGAWNEYVPKYLLTRLHGFELLMAPYAIAHMKIGLKLNETGYLFGSDERARIYLTNSLEPPSDIQRQLEDISPAMAHEAQAVNEIKRRKCFTVIIGNPPYERDSVNKGDFILGLMDSYKKTMQGERNYQPLSDDYIKFIRVSQQLIEKSGCGVFSMVTNRSYLHGIIHRGMRNFLCSDYNQLHILDLHGGSKPAEDPPAGKTDKNVFDITMGVCISTFVHTSTRKNGDSCVRYAEIWGSRDEKSKYLNTNDITTVQWQELPTTDEYRFFIPKNSIMASEFQSLGPQLPAIFPLNSSGIKTKRDHFVVEFEENTLRKRIEDFINCTGDGETVKKRFGLKDLSEWDMMKRREAIANDKSIEENFITYMYRTFDVRYIFYHKDAVARPCREVMQNLLGLKGKNLSLLYQRQTYGLNFCHIFVTRYASDVNCISNLGGTVASPLYCLIPTDNGINLQLFIEYSVRPNINAIYMKDVCKYLNFICLDLGKGDLARTIGPEDLLHYIYAIMHSPGYRKRYQEYLKIEFPRIPIPLDRNMFCCLSQIGADLVALHLLEDNYEAASWNPGNSPFTEPIAQFVGKNQSEVMKGHPKYTDGRVYINYTQYFEGVPKNVWQFYIGGYQVCEKWLKDRKGRQLSADDIAHYQKIVVALNETIRIMGEIDKVIEKHGGWPGAFITAQKDL